MSRNYTGFKDHNQNDMFVGDLIRVLIRNNVEMFGRIIELDGDYCVDTSFGRKIIIAKCYEPVYDSGLDTDHPICGKRYCVFYKQLDAPKVI